LRGRFRSAARNQGLNERFREAGVDPLQFNSPRQFADTFRQLIYNEEELSHLISLLSDGNDWAFNVIKQDGTSCNIPLTGPRAALNNLIELLRDPHSLQPIEFHCVSESEQIVPNDIDDIQIWQVTKDYKRNAVIGFIPYAHTTKFDLSRYQFYHYDERPEFDESCLIHALRLSGVDEYRLTMLKERLPQGFYTEKTNLHQVANLLGVQIRLRQCRLDNQNKIRQPIYTYDYGKEGPLMRLACMLNHAFVYERSRYYRYVVDHYDEVKD